jgi:threonine dehydrogenase-like Zn-dependent dehydrogenase
MFPTPGAANRPTPSSSSAAPRSAAPISGHTRPPGRTTPGGGWDVEAIGADVRTLNVGDLVVMPFSYSDGTCQFCREGLQTSCVHGGIFGTPAADGAQAEAVRAPLADGTLLVLPVGEDHALLPSLLMLSDVMATGHHTAVVAGVDDGSSAADRRRPLPMNPRDAARTL